MIWLIKNFVSRLLLFPCSPLLAACAAWVFRKRWPRAASACAAASLGGLLILSTVGLSARMIGWIEGGVPALDLDAPGLASRADAIVVLGAGRSIATREYSGRDVVSASGLLRLRYAAELARRVRKPILMGGGAPDRPGRSEASLMADALKEDFGTQAQWTEERSVNTDENARFSYEILSKGGVKRVFVVTNAWHMPRALRVFRKAGFLDVVPAPMGYLGDLGNAGTILDWLPSTTGMEISSVFFHEIVGAVWYRATGAY